MNFLKKLFGGDRSPSRPADEVRLQTVARQAVLDGNVEDVWAVFCLALHDLSTTGRIDLWTINVSGFDGDQRELFEIPEVRTWSQAIHEKCSKMLASFLDAPTLRWYLASLFEIDVIGREGGRVLFRHKAKSQIEEYARGVVIQISSHCMRKGLSNEEAAKVSQAALGRISVAVGTDLSYIFQ